MTFKKTARILGVVLGCSAILAVVGCSCSTNSGSTTSSLTNSGAATSSAATAPGGTTSGAATASAGTTSSGLPHSDDTNSGDTSTGDTDSGDTSTGGRITSDTRLVGISMAKNPSKAHWDRIVFWADGRLDVTVGGSAARRGTYDVVYDAGDNLAVTLRVPKLSPTTLSYSFEPNDDLVLSGDNGATYQRQ